MIFGIGTDIVSVARIADVLDRYGDHFKHRVLVDNEARDCAASSHPARFLAKRFAAKEAFSKAFGTGIGAEVGWHDLQVGHDARGKPLIQVTAALQARLSLHNITAIHLSLSDETDYAQAFVVLESHST
ncbi:MAG: holo-ACP synthase [Betaproteobacteria bacterium]|nr:holo-ACP synthase [Betaproteobacteria bacterium]